MIYQKIDKGLNGAKLKQILIKVTEEEKDIIDTVKQVNTETTGKNYTYKNLINAGISKAREDPFIDLRIEQQTISKNINDLERKKEYYNLYFDDEIKRLKTKYREITEQINSPILINMENISNLEKKQLARDKEEKERIKGITNNAIANIKEVITQRGYIKFNNEVEKVINLTLSQPSFKDAPINEVTEAIKEMFNNSEEPKQANMEEVRVNNNLKLNEEEQKAFKNAENFVLNRYERYKENKQNITLVEFWNKQNSPNRESKKKLMYVVNQRFFNNFDNDTQKNLKRLLNKHISN